MDLVKRNAEIVALVKARNLPMREIRTCVSSKRAPIQSQMVRVKVSMPSIYTPKMATQRSRTPCPPTDRCEPWPLRRFD
jgi:hypothetical protein